MALTPSQRMTFLREVAERLGREDYNLIDTTLRQFSLPWSDQWEGTKEGYILNMTETASDEQLADLASHVGYRFEMAPLAMEPSFWRKGMLRLFVSHLAKYRQYAGELQETLLWYGISAFVAHNDIEPTSEWQTQIETALATCETLIALLHPTFHDSNWTDQEIGFAMGRGLSVYAVDFGQVPYGFIGRFQAFKGTDLLPSELAQELFESYRKNKRTERRMAEVLMSLFQDSGSFAEAKARIGYLEELRVWEPSFSTRIESALESNSQISGAWGVPDRVNRLTNKWKRGRT
jgi:hypothetical protein